MHRGLCLLLLMGCPAEEEDDGFVPPIVFITSHADGASVPVGDTLALEGSVSDDLSAATDVTVRWSIDGAEVCAGSGVDDDDVARCSTSVALGERSIRFEGTDTDGASSFHEIVVTFAENQPPTVRVVSPVADAVLFAEQSHLFDVVIDDPDGEVELSTVVWSSDLGDDLSGVSGNPGFDGRLQKIGDLQAGEHALTVTVTDPQGARVSETLDVTVQSDNTDPDCVITTPTAGDVSTMLSMAGTVADGESALGSLVLSLSSSVDGDLGVPDLMSDGSWSADVTLSAGVHTLTFDALDPQGGSCAASVQVTAAP